MALVATQPPFPVGINVAFVVHAVELPGLFGRSHALLSVLSNGVADSRCSSDHMIKL